MRMMYKRYQIMNRFAERLHTAAEHCMKIHDANGDMLFDAMAMTGYELQSFDYAYWRPYERRVKDVIDDIVRVCMKYETEEPGINSVTATYMMRVVAEHLISVLEAMADYFKHEEEIAPSEVAPIIVLFNRTFKIHTISTGSRNGKQKQLDKERAIRHEQLKVHIIHIQTQTDAALQNLDRAITELTDLLGGGGQ